MRVNTRIAKLERISAAYGPCRECWGEGSPLLKVTRRHADRTEQVEQRGGCGRCGNISSMKHLILGPRPSHGSDVPSGVPTCD
ncbi:MAG: hypothetical protein H7Y88_03620 [Phycisphaerales bacterium]|nr:hypothetical protein [Phycisphaerales bacterium]